MSHKLDPKSVGKVTRSEKQKPGTEDTSPAAVSSGPIDKVIDYAFNPSRDKIREMTIIDRMQGRLLPVLDLANTMYHYCIEVAVYREDPQQYLVIYGRPKPIPPDPVDELLYRVAQWQKSVAGKNMERAMDLALAEQEAKAGEDEGGTYADAWKD